MLHISNLLHLLLLTACWFIVVALLRSTGGTRLASVMRLLQVLPLLFFIDLLAGFTLIERLYGPHQAAGWMSKSVVIFPVLFLAFVWKVFRGKRRQQVD